MEYKWILDVIADVRTFARQNDLPDLASHMDTAWLLASAEIASLPKDKAHDERGAPATIGNRTPVS
ncbi:MAG: hypothetical protein AAFY35_17250 [Pseudomonadota bacterium]